MSERLKNVCVNVFGNIVKAGFEWISDWKSPKPVHINYSDHYIPEAINIKPSGLLFEKGINPRISDCLFPGKWNDLPTLFHHGADEGNALPFDIFAASFFLLSRYEEYLQFWPDSHNRFSANQSVAFKYGFLHRPVVNEWWIRFAGIVNTRFQNELVKMPIYQYLPTIDIDSMFAFKHKGFRNLAGALRNLLKGNFSVLKERILVSLGFIKDPFDVFNDLASLFEKYRLEPVFFFLMADYGRYDKSVSSSKKAMQTKVKELTGRYNTGIHPGYQSNFDKSLLLVEIARLKKIGGKDIFRSRQHYLMIHFPDTCENLLVNGITEDYTLGYADMPGFRAGTCSPYYFYSFKNEETTVLKLFPFQIMDVTLRHYMKLNREEALFEAKKIIDNIKKVGGLFISLWHNESLSDKFEWANWRDVYEQMTRYATLAET